MTNTDLHARQQPYKKPVFITNNFQLKQSLTTYENLLEDFVAEKTKQIIKYSEAGSKRAFDILYEVYLSYQAHDNLAFETLVSELINHKNYDRSSKKWTRTLSEVNEELGKMPSNKKMPSTSWAINARDCITGSKLHQVENSTCSDCYALKGSFTWPNTIKANDRRKVAFDNNPLEWTLNFVEYLARSKKFQSVPFHRWFGSGDLQSLRMLQAIHLISIISGGSHWLPTREHKIVRQFNTELGDWNRQKSEHLTIRVSAPMKNQITKSRVSFNTSSVHLAEEFKVLPRYDEQTEIHTAKCLAFQNNGECGPCRECWQETTQNVTYKSH